MQVTELVSLLSWLLPLLAFLCLGGAVLLAARKQRMLAMAGIAISAAGLLVAVLFGIVSIYVSATGNDDLRGALIGASWSELGPPLWEAAVIATLVGLIIFAAAGAYLPQWSVGALEARILGWLRSPGPQPRRQLITGAVLVIIGATALYRPLATARVVVYLVALAVLADGVARISRVSADSRAATEAAEPESPDVTSRGARRWLRPSIVGLALAGLVAYLVVASLPVTRSVAVTAAASNPNACNGHVELCSRRYDQVAYVATHNSMSAADEPGWFIPEQPTGIVGQLNAGVRALLFDTWYGQQTERKGVIANAGSTQKDALDQANAEYGEAVVQSALRLRSSLSLTPRGPVTPYLCHALCPLGSSPMLAQLKDVRKWLAAHPREVVTFILEDSITAEDTAKIFDEAGLMPYVHTQVSGQTWPTLGEMISSGKRLQVFMQRSPGGAANPWLIKAWDWIQDTPYDNSSPTNLSCERLRGEPSNSLLLINNILNRFDTRVSDSAKINAYDALMPYLERCQQARGQLPNFVAVDYYSKGNVFAVVDNLNGFS